MKIIIFIILILNITINNISFVKSDDLVCLKSLLNKLFQVPGDQITTLCSNTLIEGPNFQYQAFCISSYLTYLYIRSKIEPDFLHDSTTLTYSDLNCFTDIQDLELTKVRLKKNVFGTDEDKQVATRLYLYNNTFVDGKLSKDDYSISKNTTLVRLLVNDKSNLTSIDFKDIKYVKDFILEYVNLSISNYPIISNSLTSSDNGVADFHSILMTVKEIHSFDNIKAESLYLNLKNSASIQNYNLLNTFNQVEKLSLFYDQDIDYPINLGSSLNTGIKELSLGGTIYIDPPSSGNLKAPPTSGVPLPPNLEALTISNSPNFNINGNLPFISIPSTLTSFMVNNIGLKSFPTLPNTIKTFIISSNNFSTTGPVSLPDLSQYINLYSFYLDNCSYSGVIPESYCIYNAYLTNNDLSGSWPQCMVCYKEEYDEHFDGNSKLAMGTCEKGSVQPNNLVYDQDTNKLELTGKNLGINGATINGTNIQFQVSTVQSSYYAFWDSSYGILGDTLLLNFGFHQLIVATKVLVPKINSITKSGNSYSFSGLNFSYNKSDIKILVSGIQGVINYIDFNNIEVVFGSLSLPIGQDIPASIQNIKSKNSSEIIKFTINTMQDKTSIIQNCNTTCNEDLNYGRCSSTTGKCICTTIYYSGEKCDTISQFLSSVSSTTTQGGVVNLYGWFADIDKGLKVEIGDQVCNVHYFNRTFSNCTIASGSGTKSIKVTQNGITWTGENMFHYTELTYKCPKDCSINGTQYGQCNILTGECKCYIGYGGFDCNSKTDTSTSTTTSTTSTTSGSYETPVPTLSPIEIPKSTTTINDTLGSVAISNQQTSYEISIISLVEMDILDNIVYTYNLTNNWILSESKDNIHIFKQTIQETTCNITYTIEEVKEPRDYDFAGLKLSLDQDSIKITIKIENYPFTSALNRLQLRLESSANQNENSTLNNQCNNKDTHIDTGGLDKDQLLNYITVSKNEKILYARFINRVLSDTRQSFITTSLISNITSNIDNKQSFVIGLNLPSFTESLTIDPDFSVLTSSSFKECNSNGIISNSRKSWVLPVAIVVPCVFVASIIIISSIIFRKNRTRILLTKQKFTVSLKSLSKQNKDELYIPE